MCTTPMLVVSDFTKTFCPSLADLQHLLDTQYIVIVCRKGDMISSIKHVNAWWEDISYHHAWKKVVEEVDLDNIYNLTARKADYVDLASDGKMSWRSTSSCDSDSDQDLENWQNRLHEVLMRRCAYMTKSLRWIGFEVCEPPSFNGTNDLDSFVYMYQMKIPEKGWLRALDVALKATPARWWSTHKKHIEDWSQSNTLMKIRFLLHQSMSEPSTQVRCH